jgi:hypothetical protein
MMESRFRGKVRHWQNYGSIESIAAESFSLAKSQVYGKARPRLPVIPVHRRAAAQLRDRCAANLAQREGGWAAVLRRCDSQRGSHAVV